MNNWSINNEDGQAVTVTDVSQAVVVAPNGSTTLLMKTDVMIDNPGPNDVFVRAGGQSVLASVRSMRVPAGSVQPYERSNTTHIALVCKPGQAQAVVVHIGAGQ